MLKTFSLCCAQSEEDVERLRLLGAAQVEHLGNLKSAAPPLPADPVRLDSLRAACAGRPVWCAVSTHAGEELTIGRIHRTLAQSLPNLLTIIAPRHPERGALVAGELESLGLRVSRRGQGGMPQGETGVYIADTVGELGLFFRVCPVVFMGKSLVPLGGQNPLEPARLGCVVLFGPFMDNFAEIARRMIAQGAAIPVQDAEELTAQVHSLLTDQEKILEFSRKSKNFTDLEAKVLDRILKHLAPFLLAAETGALVDDASHARA